MWNSSILHFGIDEIHLASLFLARFFHVCKRSISSKIARRIVDVRMVMVKIKWLQCTMVTYSTRPGKMVVLRQKELYGLS
jgi:hypothetical protein